MSSERINEVLKQAGVPIRTTAQDDARTDAMAEQMQAVIDVVAQWDSPGLYENAGARERCEALMNAHHKVDVDKLKFRTESWDFISADSDDFVELPPFDPNIPEHQSVSRLIFAKSPKVVRVFRGGVFDAIAPYLLNIARGSHWHCDWGYPTHPIKPTAFTYPDTGQRHVTHSKPYLVTKARGEFLLVFVVCTQCLEDLISRGSEHFGFGPNSQDRELIDGTWLPIWRNPHKAKLPNGPVVTQWSGNEDQYPSDEFLPAAYLINGIRFVVPHSSSGWREADDRTFDDLPV